MPKALPAGRPALLALAGASVAMGAAPARALDGFEIQVYDGQANAPRETSLEVHLNHTLQRHLPRQWQEQAARGHLTHATFEFAYGLTRWCELGAYLQLAMPVEPRLRPRYGGSKLRGKFIVPHEISGRWRMGANLEMAFIPMPFDSTRWGGEIRPILGYRAPRWEVIANPIIDLNLAEPTGTSLSPAVKVARVVGGAWALGAEYYGGTLPTQDNGDLRLQEQYVFAAVDLWDRPLELNLAIGRGLTHGAQSWVVKTIVGFPLT